MTPPSRLRGPRLIKPLDVVILALTCALTVVLALRAYGGAARAPRVVVRGPDAAWVFPLDAEETLRVHGPLGDTVVTLHEGRVSVTSSPCPNQTCVTAPPVTRPGQWTACLPNQVMVLIEGAPPPAAPDTVAW